MIACPDLLSVAFLAIGSAAAVAIILLTLVWALVRLSRRR